MHHQHYSAAWMRGSNDAAKAMPVNILWMPAALPPKQQRRCTKRPVMLVAVPRTVLDIGRNQARHMLDIYLLEASRPKIEGDAGPSKCQAALRASLAPRCCVAELWSFIFHVSLHFLEAFKKTRPLNTPVTPSIEYFSDPVIDVCNRARPRGLCNRARHRGSVPAAFGLQCQLPTAAASAAGP